MADRSIVLRLRAEVRDALSGLDKTATAAKKVGDATEQASKKSKFSLDGTAASIRKNEEHYDRLGNAALIGGGAIAAGLGLGVKAFVDFDSAMSGVNAALPEAGAQMGKLRQLAIDLGKDTQYSSTEAAQGITELAKAGTSTGDILNGGLAGALSLAAAGELEVGRAAEIAATAVNQFGLTGRDVAHVADLFAAAAGKAQGSVEDIANAMKYVGPVANSMGISIEEATGVIALFASQGIIGEQAGTSFRSMLLSLTSPSTIAKKALDEYNISLYDGQNNLKSMSQIAGELQAGLGGLDQAERNAALGRIFGNESMAAAITLYEGGAAAVDSWTAKVNDTGFAAEQARLKTDNLKGDIERLTGALDSVAVSNGGGVNDFLRDLTQGAEGAVEAFGRLPSGVQQGVLGFALLAAGGLLAVGAFAKVVTTGANMLESLTAIQYGGGRAAKGLDAATKGAKGLATAGVVIAATAISLKALVDASNDDFSMPGVGQLTRDLTGAADASGALDRAFSTTGQTINGSKSLIDGFDQALKVATDPSRFQQFEGAAAGLLGMFGDTKVGVVTEQFDGLDQTLTSLFRSGHTEEADRLYSTLRDRAAEAGVSVDELNKLIPGYTDAVAGAASEQELAAKSGESLTGALDETGDAAAEAETKLSDLVDQIRGFGSEADAAQSAEAGFQAAIDDATASIKENGRTLDLNSEAGRANDSALRAIAQGARDATAETFNLSGSQDAATAKMQAGRDAFIAAAIAAGQTATGAAALADKYGLIPDDVTTAVSAPGAVGATAEVAALDDTIFRLDGKVVTVKEEGANPSKAKVIDLDASILGLKGKTVKVEELGTNASGERVVRFQGKIYALRGKTVPVGVDANTGGIDAFQRRINALRGNDVTITTRYVTVGRRPGGGFSTAGGLMKDAANGGMFSQSAGSLIQSFASGGHWEGSFGSAQPQIRPAGGRGIRWAEEGAGPWEAFVSGHPLKRGRSRSITEDLVDRLGGQVQWYKSFADGGLQERSYAARPAPMSVRPVVNVTGGAATDLAPLQASILALGADIRSIRHELNVNGRQAGEIVAAGTRANGR